MTTPPLVSASVDAVELDLFLEALYRRYHYDFRGYSRASLERRVSLACSRLNCATLTDLQRRLLHEPEVVPEIINTLTVQVSDLFRDPLFFLALRRDVIPHLHTFPQIKVWVAGCADGEELYSLAILFREEGLFDRTLFYATEINREAIARAEAGVYDIERVAQFSRNYQLAGGRSSLSDYYAAGYGRAVFDRSLRSRTVFTEHNLATDQVFSEVHLVTCRNVLIYFDNALQDRAIGLFSDSLARGGFLGLGSHETLRFSKHLPAFATFDESQRIWRRTSLQEASHAR